MKKFWKILGLGALAAGLTPYKVETNEETGEKSYQALLWRITSSPAEGEKSINIIFSEGTLTSKLMGTADQKDEPHLFSDELSVEYVANRTEEAEEETVKEAEETAEPAEEPAAEEPKEPEEPAEPETPEAE